MRGWLAVIAKEKLALRQVVGYRELALLFEFYEEFEINGPTQSYSGSRLVCTHRIASPHWGRMANLAREPTELDPCRLVRQGSSRQAEKTDSREPSQAGFGGHSPRLGRAQPKREPL